MKPWVLVGNLSATVPILFAVHTTSSSKKPAALHYLFPSSQIGSPNEPGADFSRRFFLVEKMSLFFLQQQLCLNLQQLISLKQALLVPVVSARMETADKSKVTGMCSCEALNVKLWASVTPSLLAQWQSRWHPHILHRQLLLPGKAPSCAWERERTPRSQFSALHPSCNAFHSFCEVCFVREVPYSIMESFCLFSLCLQSQWMPASVNNFSWYIGADFSRRCSNTAAASPQHPHTRLSSPSMGDLLWEEAWWDEFLCPTVCRAEVADCKHSESGLLSTAC